MAWLAERHGCTVAVPVRRVLVLPAHFHSVAGLKTQLPACAALPHGNLKMPLASHQSEGTPRFHVTVGGVYPFPLTALCHDESPISSETTVLLLLPSECWRDGQGISSPTEASYAGDCVTEVVDVKDLAADAAGEHFQARERQRGDLLNGWSKVVDGDAGR